MITRNLHSAIALTHARRASGLVRTLVVGSATLAILLVCFSMYQYVQLEPNAPGDDTAQRIPRKRTEPSGITSSGGDIPSTDVGNRGVGPGENVSLTIYPREGREARFEIEVRDWTPVPGAANEFRLLEPTVRMRTSDDHAVRITAKEGSLEAKRRGGAGLDPQRGKLSGDVVIEYDRLTTSQREALPLEERDVIDPAQIVRIEMDELEFDLEYAKLIIPGPLRLSARDVVLEAANLELRFNESQNRVESLRVSGGGRIELLAASGAASFAGAGGASGAAPRTIAQWLRETIRAKLAAQAHAAATPAMPNASDTIGSVTPEGMPVTKEGKPVADDGIPVFRAGELDEEGPTTPLHYLARFEGSIDAVQLFGEQTTSRLQADTLEILRDFADGDPLAATERTTKQAAEPEPTAAPEASKSGKRIVLTWSDRLVVQALNSDDAMLAGGVRSRITAKGSPARVSYPDGDAVCRQLIYEPDNSEMQLHGTESDPVFVRSREQGTLTGTLVHYRTDGDRFFVDVTGPGRLLTPVDEPAPDQAESSVSAQPVAALLAALNPSEHATTNNNFVSFEEKLEVEGTIKSKTTIDFTGGISTKRHSIPERATFTGHTSVRQDTFSMDADVLEVRFGVQENLRGIDSYIDGFTGTGHVSMVQEEGRLACRELDVTLMRDANRRVWAKTVVARGDVDAVQGDRTIRARDRLIVDFELYHESPEEPARAPSMSRIFGELRPSTPKAVEASTSVEAQTASLPPRIRAGVKRFRAFGEVVVVDPSQFLDVSGEELDCRLAPKRGEIEEAVVVGTDERPANVRLDDVTTIGKRINLNVPDEWVEVPGAGRMSLQSNRDLDGSELGGPRPIVITWTTGMRYQGRENRAVFGGGVHAYSRSTTTFDCQRLEIEFDEVAKTKTPRSTKPGRRPWLMPALSESTCLIGRWFLPGLTEPICSIRGWLGPELLEKIGGKLETRQRPRREFSREPAVIWATGAAKAVTAEIDETTGEMKSRMRIEGPKLAVYLRPEVSKMLIEGGGNLLLEQFEQARSEPDVADARNGELFDVESGGPSKTLIEWQDMMVYDFAIDQTRFEGDVSLKHFSGRELQKRFGGVPAGSADAAPGRSTYLACDVLTVDFLGSDTRPRRDRPERMGRLSTRSLRQFDASGSVRLNDVSQGLQVWADKIIYERPRELLAIYGEPSRKARIVKRRADRLPLQIDVERLFYNLKTGMPEISDLDVR